jgi:hypothetical protein
VAKQITDEQSDHDVSLAFGASRLFVGWTGEDDRLSVAATEDGGASGKAKKILGEKSKAKPNILHGDTS